NPISSTLSMFCEFRKNMEIDAQKVTMIYPTQRTVDLLLCGVEECSYILNVNVNFGDVFIPNNLEVPKPRVLPEFKRLAHGLRSGNISVLDAKTFYIPNLHYDGAGPDAYFWVGNGTDPSPLGIKVPNEMG
ncbi:hypothetical protein L9F63_018017, partial [Diploptera punctata]